jgi:hypothetical protein
MVKKQQRRGGSGDNEEDYDGDFGRSYRKFLYSHGPEE